MPYVRRGGLPVCRESGVYSILNMANGKVYVGSALCIRGRLLYHRSYLRRGKHNNEHLQRAWDKHGEKEFWFNMIEVCEPDQIIEQEQYWIDALETCDSTKGYNICPVAGPGAMRGRKHSEKSKAQMSAQRKGMDTSKATAAAAIANRGRKIPAEVVEKRAAALRGKKKSVEHREQLVQNHWTKQPGAEKIIAAKAARRRDKKLTTQHRTRISLANFTRWRKQKLQRGVLQATTS